MSALKEQVLNLIGSYPSILTFGLVSLCVAIGLLILKKLYGLFLFSHRRKRFFAELIARYKNGE